ncbi:hypothetical protein ACFVXG_14715 [Kitasatospora sp. NPDC058162]|uniref:hypothetical protein n=1 Tax=Kitasatospora sp. NPDC058162 TaxID=3346362 RepID=UPI0036D80C27
MAENIGNIGNIGNMEQNVDESVDGGGEETAEVEAHVANVLDLQALKFLQASSDGNCFSIVSYVNSAETSAS